MGEENIIIDEATSCFKFESIGTLPKDLPIVHHEPVYDMPFPLKYRNLNLSQRAKMLYDYHTKCSDIKNQIAKRSWHMAPNAKPILPSIHCKNSLLKSDDDATVEMALTNSSNNNSIGHGDDMNSDYKEFFTSRKGRQVKKKTYTEDPDEIIDNDSDIVLEKYLDQHSKIVDQSDLKITIDTPLVINNNNNNNDVLKTISKSSNQTSSPAIKRTYNNISKHNSSRTDLIFDNLKKEEEQQQQKQQRNKSVVYDAFDDFEETLARAEDESLDDFNKKHPPETLIEREFIKRISPPSKKKGSVRKRNALPIDLDEIQVVPKVSSMESPNVESRLKRRKLLNAIENTQPKKNVVACPICNKEFSENVVQVHASSCSDFPKEIATASGTATSLTCELCDSTFLNEVEYTQHARTCIATIV